MSRKIAGAVIYDQDIISITYLLRKLKIIDKRNNIRGCGMDMLFEVSYVLFLTLHPAKSIKINFQDMRGTRNVL